MENYITIQRLNELEEYYECTSHLERYFTLDAFIMHLKYSIADCTCDELKSDLLSTLEKVKKIDSKKFGVYVVDFGDLVNYSCVNLLKDLTDVDVNINVVVRKLKNIKDVLYNMSYNELRKSEYDQVEEYVYTLQREFNLTIDNLPNFYEAEKIFSNLSLSIFIDDLFAELKQNPHFKKRYIENYAKNCDGYDDFLFPELNYNREIQFLIDQYVLLKFCNVNLIKDDEAAYKLIDKLVKIIDNIEHLTNVCSTDLLDDNFIANSDTVKEIYTLALRDDENRLELEDIVDKLRDFDFDGRYSGIDRVTYNYCELDIDNICYLNDSVIDMLDDLLNDFINDFEVLS